MIVLYSGTPGSGKSLHAARIIRQCIKQNIPVIANFEIDYDAIKTKRKKGNFQYLDNTEISPEYLKQYALQYFRGKTVKEESIFLFIDEAQLLFNAREWGKKGRSDWLSFFTQHRKYGYHIVLCAQFDRMIDRQIRSLIEYEYIHRKVSNFGWKGQIMSLLVGGKLFVSVKVWYPMKEKVGAEFYVAMKRDYNLYNTFLDFSRETRCSGVTAQNTA